MRKIRKTTTGYYAKQTNHFAIDGFDGCYTKYYTKEELEEERRLYKEKAKYPEIDLEYLISTELDLKEKFSCGLKRVLKFIEPKYTNLWVEKQSAVSRVVLDRALYGEFTPNLQNFFRLLYFIERHIENFNVWSLIDPDAPIQKTSDFTPFEKHKGIVYNEYRPSRNRRSPYDD